VPVWIHIPLFTTHDDHLLPGALLVVICDLLLEKFGHIYNLLKLFDKDFTMFKKFSLYNYKLILRILPLFDAFILALGFD
jgi:hypothetical protein